MSFSAIFSAIAQGVVKGITSWIQQWYDRERREAAEWAAKSKEAQLESFKEGKALEQKMKNAQESAPLITNVNDWNERAKQRNLANTSLLIILCLFGWMQVGCFRFYVTAREYRPIIPTPEMPLLSEEAPFSDPDFLLLVEYIERLQSAVDLYNEKAHESNKEHGY